MKTIFKFGAGFVAGAYCAAQVFKGWVDAAGRAEQQQGMPGPSSWDRAQMGGFDPGRRLKL